MIKVVSKTVGVPAHPRHLADVRKMVEGTLKEAGVPRRTADAIVVAVDEAVSSMVHYAQFLKLDTEITLNVDVDDVRFKATLHDAMNVFGVDGGLSEAGRNELIQKERGHGLGVYLMRRIMDEIHYTYRKGFENDLVLIRFLD
jgi:anti-sigma regulatory factor (Ser/Thr protein kinase)